MRVNVVPQHTVFCRCHEESARDLVSVRKGVRHADRCLLQPLPTEAHPAFGTLIRDKEAEDVFLTVTEFDHTLVHREQHGRLCVRPDSE